MVALDTNAVLELLHARKESEASTTNAPLERGRLLDEKLRQGNVQIVLLPHVLYETHDKLMVAHALRKQQEQGHFLGTWVRNWEDIDRDAFAASWSGPDGDIDRALLISLADDAGLNVLPPTADQMNPVAAGVVFGIVHARVAPLCDLSDAIIIAQAIAARTDLLISRDNGVGRSIGKLSRDPSARVAIAAVDKAFHVPRHAKTLT